MSTVRVEAAGQETLDRAQRLLAGIKGGMDKAVKAAMDRAVSHLRSNSARAIRERYAISVANIRASENVKVSYNYHDGPTAKVMFFGQKIPLYRYDGAAPAHPTPDTSKWVEAMVNGQYRWVHPSVAAQGHQLKETSPSQFHHAFTAQMKSGHVGIFERNGKASGNGGDAIVELMGSSVPQMLGSEDVEKSLTDEAMASFEKDLDHNVMAILSGYMR